jgi:hypothetical protein
LPSSDHQSCLCSRLTPQDSPRLRHYSTACPPVLQQQSWSPAAGMVLQWEVQQGLARSRVHCHRNCPRPEARAEAARPRIRHLIPHQITSSHVRHRLSQPEPGSPVEVVPLASLCRTMRFRHPAHRQRNPQSSEARVEAAQPRDQLGITCCQVRHQPSCLRLSPSVVVAQQANQNWEIRFHRHWTMLSRHPCQPNCPCPEAQAGAAPPADQHGPTLPRGHCRIFPARRLMAVEARRRHCPKFPELFLGLRSVHAWAVEVREQPPRSDRW